eukprot:COSAG01_NODE_45688_length_407_cov_0.668831_1_plen_83_part_01
MNAPSARVTEGVPINNTLSPSAADSPAAAAVGEYAHGAPGTERPYGPETTSVASEGKGEERHFRQSHCHDPELNAEAEGGNLS